MAIVSVAEVYDGRAGDLDLKAARNYSRRFEVITDDDDDGPSVASAASGIPLIGTPYLTAVESDPGALAYRISSEQSGEDPRVWYVTVEYTSELDFPEAGEGPPDAGTTPADPTSVPANPLSRAPTWTWKTRQTQRPLIKSYPTSPGGGFVNVLNSAGFPFDPPPMIEWSQYVLTLTVNKATFNIGATDRLVNSVNSTLWLGFDPRTVRVEDLEVNPKFENGVAYYEYKYSLGVEYDTWDYEILDAGYYERESESLPPRKILDEQGREPTGPYPLKNGLRLPPGEAPVYLKFRGRKEVNFNGKLP